MLSLNQSPEISLNICHLLLQSTPHSVLCTQKLTKSFLSRLVAQSLKLAADPKTGKLNFTCLIISAGFYRKHFFQLCFRTCSGKGDTKGEVSEIAQTFCLFNQGRTLSEFSSSTASSFGQLCSSCRALIPLHHYHHFCGYLSLNKVTSENSDQNVSNFKYCNLRKLCQK